MTAESAHLITAGSDHARSGRRNRGRGVAVTLVVTVSLVASCAGSESTSSSAPSSTSTTSTTAVPSPVCDALVGAVGTMLTGDGAADWSSMLATLSAVTPQLPEDLRRDWMIVLDRLSAMANGPGAAPLDLNDPASVQRYAEQLMSADQPDLTRALGNIQAFVEASCPL